MANRKATLTPYQEAARDGVPFLSLRIDLRTQDPKAGWLHLEGPCSTGEARQVAKLIARLSARRKK